MDFKTLMAAQISKSKHSPSAAAAGAGTTTTTTDTSKPKYLKRAELEAQRQAEYAAEQAQAEKEREERLAKKRRFEEEEAERAQVREEKKRRLAEESRRRREEREANQERLRRKRLGLPELVDQKEGTPGDEGEADLPDDQLLAKLRELEEPAILFGETHGARLRRYRNLTDQVLAPKLSQGPIPTTLALVPETEMLIPPRAPPRSERAAHTFLYRQLASYFTMVLREWDVALSRRDGAVKESYAGRAAYTAMTEARANMVPLFRKFEAESLEWSVLEAVVEIVRCAQERRYVDANDGYLRLSIGKAAWPIGVTMVGIHERSAREKLHQSDKNQAHIMSDEVTRKFLQSIKRCLSFAQTRWPPDDQLQLMG